jgi:hypothetical protein
MSWDWGSVPQWVTGGVAIVAVGAAIWSVISQREIARKRAAMDFFVKTEMDRDTLVAHKRFTDATKKLKEGGSKKEDFEEFAKTSDYANIRDYLNLHELMAVGLFQKVFDDDVCYFFWSGELKRAYGSTQALIAYIQELPGEAGTYIELVKVAKRWAKKKAVQ